MKFIKSMKTKALAVFTVLCMLAGSAGVYVNADTNGNPIMYTVNFGSGAWTINDLSVTSDQNGEKAITESDTITLTGFNHDTMIAQVYTLNADDQVDFRTELSVFVNSDTKVATTHLSDKDSQNYPGNATLYFEVIQKPAREYSVNFGKGSWEINGVTVNANVKGEDLSGEVLYRTIKDSDVITLSNFNAGTMVAKVTGVDGFNTVLPVVEGKTSLSSSNANYPDGTLNFVVETKPGDNNQNQGQQQKFRVNFGEGEWTVNGVTVKSDKKGTNDITDKDIITLTGFNPDTMIAKVTAEDGFNVELAVNNGTTSLSARTNNGGYPNSVALTFAVEVKQNNSQGGGNSEQPSNTDSSATVELNGNISFKINDSNTVGHEEVETKTYTVGYNKKTDENGNKIDAVDITVSWLVNQKLEALTINGNEYSGYLPKTSGEYLKANKDQIYEIVIPNVTLNADKENTITGTATEFEPGEMPVGNLKWAYEAGENVQDDELIGNGRMELVQIVYNDDTYSADKLPEWITWDQDDLKGGAVLPLSALVTVRLVPEYGYQLYKTNLNDTTFLADESQQSVFTFPVKSGNFHLGASFKKTDDKVQSSSTVVTDGSVTLNGDVITEGTVIVNVNDVNTGTQEFEEAIPAEMNDYYVNNVVEIGMDQVWYKGTDTDYWAEPITEMGDNSATVTLSAPKGQADIQVMHEKHDGTYEVLDGTQYNPETGELTFTTDSFSRFALVYKEEMPSGLHINVFDENPALGEIYMDGKKISFNADYENVYGKHTFRIVSPQKYKIYNPGVLIGYEGGTGVNRVELTKVDNGYEFTVDLNQEKSENWFLDVCWNEFYILEPEGNECMVSVYIDGLTGIIPLLSDVTVKKTAYDGAQIKYIIERTSKEQAAKLYMNTVVGKVMTAAIVGDTAYGEPQAEGEKTEKLVGDHGLYEFDLVIDPLGEESRDYIGVEFIFEKEQKHTYDEKNRCTGCGVQQNASFSIAHSISNNTAKVILNTQEKIAVNVATENMVLPVVAPVESVDVVVSKKVNAADLTTTGKKSVTYDITPVIRITQKNGTVSYMDINTVLKQNPGLKVAVTLPLNGMKVQEVVHSNDEYGTSYLHDDELKINTAEDTATVYVSHFSTFKLNEQIEDPSYKGKTVVDTSDHSQNVLWMSLMLVSAVAAVGIIRFRKRCN